MAKQAASIRCSDCNSKHTTLYRGFGEWPTFEFKSLPEDTRTQFYKDIKHKGAAAVIAHTYDVIEAYEDNKEIYASSGEYRPLAYWKLHGYDAEKIVAEAKAEDIKQVRLVGAKKNMYIN